MTWRRITTCSLSCSTPGNIHYTYFRDGAALDIGDITKCPYCQQDSIITATSTQLRQYPKVWRKGAPDG